MPLRTTSREGSFIAELEENYPEEFIQELQKYMMDRRIVSFNKIVNESDSNGHQKDYIKSTIPKFAFFRNLLDYPNTSLPGELYCNSDFYGKVFTYYEQLVKQIHQDFDAQFTCSPIKGYDRPEVLIMELEKLCESGELSEQQESFEVIKRKAIQLVDVYKDDIHFIEDYFARILAKYKSDNTSNPSNRETKPGTNNLNTPSNSNNRSDWIFPYSQVKAKLAKTCNERLQNLSQEMKPMNVTLIADSWRFAIKNLILSLNHLIVIIEIIAMNTEI